MPEKIYIRISGEIKAMSPIEVKNALLATKSAGAWDAIVTEVKKACGGYPDWWYWTIIANDVLMRASSKWEDN